MSMWRFIDHRGDLRDLSQLEQHYPLRGFTDRQTAIDWAIRNIGLVLICETNSSVRLKLRPEKISPIAMTETLYQLAVNGQLRASISTFDNTWHHRIFSTAYAAGKHLSELYGTLSDDRSQDLLRRTLDPAALSLGTGLHELFKRWQSLGRVTTKDELLNAVPAALVDRVVLLAATSKEAQMLFRNVGSDLRVFDSRWAAHAEGRTVEDQPDFRYGRWAAESYRKALQSSAPVYDEIDAMVFNPYTQTRHRSLYRRLVVPYECSDGTKLLLGCSTLDAKINLRSKAG
jgi:hypothetical protein